eukprot:g142.t1
MDEGNGGASAAPPPRDGTEVPSQSKRRKTKKKKPPPPHTVDDCRMAVPRTPVVPPRGGFNYYEFPCTVCGSHRVLKLPGRWCECVQCGAQIRNNSAIAESDAFMNNAEARTVVAEFVAKLDEVEGSLRLKRAWRRVEAVMRPAQDAGPSTKTKAHPKAKAKAKAKRSKRELELEEEEEEEKAAEQAERLVVELVTPILMHALKDVVEAHGLPHSERGLRLAMRGVQAHSADAQVGAGLLEVRSRFGRGTQWVRELMERRAEEERRAREKARLAEEARAQREREREEKKRKAAAAKRHKALLQRLRGQDPQDIVRVQPWGGAAVWPGARVRLFCAATADAGGVGGFAWWHNAAGVGPAAGSVWRAAIVQRVNSDGTYELKTRPTAAEVQAATVGAVKRVEDEEAAERKAARRRTRGMGGGLGSFRIAPSPTASTASDLKRASTVSDLRQASPQPGSPTASVQSEGGEEEETKEEREERAAERRRVAVAAAVSTLGEQVASVPLHRLRLVAEGEEEGGEHGARGGARSGTGHGRQGVREDSHVWVAMPRERIEQKDGFARHASQPTATPWSGLNCHVRTHTSLRGEMSTSLSLSNTAAEHEGDFFVEMPLADFDGIGCAADRAAGRARRRRGHAETDGGAPGVLLGESIKLRQTYIESGTGAQRVRRARQLQAQMQMEIPTQPRPASARSVWPPPTVVATKLVYSRRYFQSCKVNFVRLLYYNAAYWGDDSGSDSELEEGDDGDGVHSDERDGGMDAERMQAVEAARRAKPRTTFVLVAGRTEYTRDWKHEESSGRLDGRVQALGLTVHWPVAESAASVAATVMATAAASSNDHASGAHTAVADANEAKPALNSYNIGVAAEGAEEMSGAAEIDGGGEGEGQGECECDGDGDGDVEGEAGHGGKADRLGDGEGKAGSDGVGARLVEGEEAEDKLGAVAAGCKDGRPRALYAGVHTHPLLHLRWKGVPLLTGDALLWQRGGRTRLQLALVAANARAAAAEAQVRLVDASAVLANVNAAKLAGGREGWNGGSDRASPSDSTPVAGVGCSAVRVFHVRPRGWVSAVAWSADGARVALAVRGHGQRALLSLWAADLLAAGSDEEGEWAPVATDQVVAPREEAEADAADGLAEEREVDGGEGENIAIAIVPVSDARTSWRRAVRRLRTIRVAGQHGAVASVCWSPDDQWLLTAGEDKILRVVDARGGPPVFSCAGHANAQLAAARKKMKAEHDKRFGYGTAEAGADDVKDDY